MKVAGKTCQRSRRTSLAACSYIQPCITYDNYKDVIYEVCIIIETEVYNNIWMHLEKFCRYHDMVLHLCFWQDSFSLEDHKFCLGKEGSSNETNDNNNNNNNYLLLLTACCLSQNLHLNTLIVECLSHFRTISTSA